MKRAPLFHLCLLGGGLLAGGAAWAQSAAGLPALAAIEKGLWELRERGSNAQPRRICVADPVALMQVRHGSSACSRFVIDNQSKRATVHYTCPGAGHGRTTIRVETSRLIQIESQGIADNSPFNFTYEGRHAGKCP